MSFWKIAWRNLRQRWVASSLTGVSMALGVAVMICVIVIHGVAVRQFKGDAQGYNLIIGSGKTGPVDVVLSTVFHVGKRIFPFPYSYYREFTDGQFAPYVEVAVPYCLGDSFVDGSRVYRVVATTPDLFDKIHYGAEKNGDLIGYEFEQGRNFKIENCYEAVIGSMVAAQTGLGAGDSFNPTHGLGAEGDQHDAFKIVGVLAPTGTANDRALFVNIEGFYLIEDHALTAKPPPVSGEMAIIGSSVADRKDLKSGDRFTPEGSDGEREVVGVLVPSGTALDDAVLLDTPSVTPPSEADGESAAPGAADEARGALPPTMCFDNQGNPVEPLPEQQREVTAVLVLCNNLMAPQQIEYGVNKNSASPAQVVSPGRVVRGLLSQIVKPVQVVLMVLTVLIVLVASVSILVSIYNSMNERSHEIAVMRALGAGRSAVMWIILSESILLSVGGGVLGILLGHGLVGLVAPYVVESTGIRLAAWQFDPLEGAILPALVGLASLVGLLPALTAYRTDVARSLGGGP